MDFFPLPDLNAKPQSISNLKELRGTDRWKTQLHNIPERHCG